MLKFKTLSVKQHTEQISLKAVIFLQTNSLLELGKLMKIHRLKTVNTSN